MGRGCEEGAFAYEDICDEAYGFGSVEAERNSRED